MTKCCDALLGLAFDGETTRSLRDLFKHIDKFLECFQFTSEIIVIALIYIDRLLIDNPYLALTKNNAKNVTFLGLTLAAKFYDDRFEKYTLFHVVGSISKQQMRFMFNTFLGLIQFDLVVKS